MKTIILFFKLLLQYIISIFRKPKFYRKKKAICKSFDNFIPFTQYNKKPSWVKYKIIYLKAVLPNYGWRKLAVTFNRIYFDKNVKVSKSYVYSLIKDNNYEILHLRRNLKHTIPKPMAKNVIWNIDLTNVSDIDKNKNTIFGIIDAGSRAILNLSKLKNKSSLTILKAIILTIEKYGKPKIIMSDNEYNFTSKVFKVSLFILGIKHKTTQVASPWENGKIERFFGTMKHTFKKLDFYNEKGIIEALAIFRFYYNHVRPHQHIDYFTPSEVWSGIDKITSKSTDEIYYFSELDGMINGFYFKPK